MKYRILTSVILTSTILLTACANDETKNEQNHQTQKAQQNNKVYDKLTDNNVIKDGPTATSKNKDTTYTLGNHDRILKVTKNLSDMPLNIQKDEKQLNDDVTSFMEKDAKLKEIKSETVKIYYSEKLNRYYYVSYKLDVNSNVTEFIVSSYKE
ncbi:hypothetical protein BUZ56_11350 [Staphylococcus hyicus]|uniref:hypothetical protein n=1 Tax=Staphylococcus hyicus TaxID=1284 RepID=UPI000D1F2636|nr:hypothetical protein [Staphylococcus hyicus]PTJ85975.1 hypothetical protein BUZ56_11350 [Staphylococcus hyicus]